MSSENGISRKHGARDRDHFCLYKDVDHIYLYLSPSMPTLALASNFSPPSSPGSCVDSSPPSSPLLDPVNSPSLGKLADPFAASFNSTSRQCEKSSKRRAAFASLPLALKRARQHRNADDENHQFDACMPLPLYVQASPKQEKSSLQKELEEWDKVDENIYKYGLRIIDVAWVVP